MREIHVETAWSSGRALVVTTVGMAVPDLYSAMARYWETLAGALDGLPSGTAGAHRHALHGPASRVLLPGSRDVSPRGHCILALPAARRAERVPRPRRCQGPGTAFHDGVAPDQSGQRHAASWFTARGATELMSARVQGSIEFCFLDHDLIWADPRDGVRALHQPAGDLHLPLTRGKSPSMRQTAQGDSEESGCARPLRPGDNHGAGAGGFLRPFAEHLLYRPQLRGDRHQPGADTDTCLGHIPPAHNRRVRLVRRSQLRLLRAPRLRSHNKSAYPVGARSSSLPLPSVPLIGVVNVSCWSWCSGSTRSSPPWP